MQGSRVLTQFPDLQDLAQHLGELDRTAAKGALVLVFSATVLQDDLRARRGREGGRGQAGEGASAGAAGPSLYPDVGVLVDFRQVQHVVQGQHPRRSLGEVHRGVDVVLGKERHPTSDPTVSSAGARLRGSPIAPPPRAACRHTTPARRSSGHVPSL